MLAMITISHCYDTVMTVSLNVYTENKPAEYVKWNEIFSINEGIFYDSRHRGVQFSLQNKDTFINDFKGEFNGLIELSLSEINAFNKPVSCTLYVIYSDDFSSSLLLFRERSVQLFWVW